MGLHDVYLLLDFIFDILYLVSLSIFSGIIQNIFKYFNTTVLLGPW